MTKLSKAIALAGAMTAGLAAVQTQAEEVAISASAAVSNTYLWRGQDLGSGTPAVSGDLVASVGGAYGGVWVSSGDTSLGSEYDLFVGYGGEAGDFSYDVSIWAYVYPGDDAVNGRGNTFETTDLIVSVGYGPVSAAYYYVLAGDDDYSYITLGAEFGAFSATLGQANSYDNDDAGVEDEDYTHLDLSYAYNDNISFTLSKVIDQSLDLDDGEPGVDEDTKVVMTYSLPIEL